MTTTCYIHTTTQHQHKLHNSKKIARMVRAIYPKIPRTPVSPTLHKPKLYTKIPRFYRVEMRASHAKAAHVLHGGCI
jgi:hypothetical protein